MKVGAHFGEQGKTEFVVWAPHLKRVSLQLLYPEERNFPLERDDHGYWRKMIPDVSEQKLYRFTLDCRLCLLSSSV